MCRFHMHSFAIPKLTSHYESQGVVLTSDPRVYPFPAKPALRLFEKGWTILRYTKNQSSVYLESIYSIYLYIVVYIYMYMHLYYKPTYKSWLCPCPTWPQEDPRAREVSPERQQFVQHRQHRCVERSSAKRSLVAILFLFGVPSWKVQKSG